MMGHGFGLGIAGRLAAGFMTQVGLTMEMVRD